MSLLNGVFDDLDGGTFLFFLVLLIILLCQSGLFDHNDQESILFFILLLVILFSSDQGFSFDVIQGE